jgi:hypothetical protein
MAISATPVVLAAIAAVTKRIRLASAVTILSTADPVLVFEHFVLQGDIDDGTRLAVAQINDSEDDNLKNAETTWLTAIQDTKDISVYMYAMRSLASNQLRQNRKVDAEQSYQSALDAALSGRLTSTIVSSIVANRLCYAESAFDRTLYPD